MHLRLLDHLLRRIKSNNQKQQNLPSKPKRKKSNRIRLKKSKLLKKNKNKKKKLMIKKRTMKKRLMILRKMKRLLISLRHTEDSHSSWAKLSSTPVGPLPPYSCTICILSFRRMILIVLLIFCLS